MNNKTSFTLRNIIKRYGIVLCDDPKRCRALLMDLCGEYIKEIRVLCMALEIKLPHELLSTGNTPFEIQRSRLAQKLTNEYAMAEDVALWCIDTWAFALGMEDNLKHNTGLKTNKPDNEEEKARRQLSSKKGASAAKISKPRLAKLGADYYIDYTSGTIPIGNLPIGTRVVDPTWQWEFRTGEYYKGTGKIKPITWILVAKDHYDGLEPHVTLLTAELIGRYPFDKSTNRNKGEYGGNHWGKSGKANATRVLRPWLNSSGIHSGDGFYQAFFESFKGAVLKTILPNREWKNGAVYSTNDHVFIPSTTEMGDRNHSKTYAIGSIYPYFAGVGDAKRSRLGGKTYNYWTRSPDMNYEYSVINIGRGGGFYSYYTNRLGVGRGVRPALNLKSEILVSEIRN